MQNHPEYTDNAPDWEQLQTCLKGERAVKSKKEKYLPFPVSGVDQTTTEFTDMYAIYISGAHFVNFTEESRADLVNSAFREKPTIQPPTPAYIPLKIPETSKALASSVISYGRSFLFTDYPSEFPSDVEPHPYLLVYNPLDILDWATATYAGDTNLTYVLLRELQPRSPSQDPTDQEYQYRELILEDNTFKVRLYLDQDSEDYQEFIPKKANGQSFNVIPGTFVGATDNLPNVDQSPILGISNSNIHHYRTWAELSSTTVYLGSPTLALTGLPAGWIKAQEKNNSRIKIGADLALAIEGDSAKAELLEINSDLTHYKTIDKLEESMSEQGYALKSNMDKNGVESASAIMLRSSSQMSKLGAIINNVEEALNLVLVYASEFMGVPAPTVTLNKDFFPQAVCEMDVNPNQLPGNTSSNKDREFDNFTKGKTTSPEAEARDQQALLGKS